MVKLSAQGKLTATSVSPSSTSGSKQLVQGMEIIGQRLRAEIVFPSQGLEGQVDSDHGQGEGVISSFLFFFSGVACTPESKINFQR